MLCLPAAALARPSAQVSRFGERRVADIVDIDDDVVLGVGGCGKVHPGHLRETGEPCAVKIVWKVDSNTRQTALREAELMQTLNNSAICQLLDMVEDDDNVYLILERIEGCDLFDHIVKQRTISEKSSADIVRQILQALDYCHGLEKPVVHRDIKPENVMVQSCGSETTAKLIDFGIADRDGSLRSALEATVPYRAPEAASSSTCTCRPEHDMWSVGVVLHVMLLGELPPPAIRAGKTPLDTNIDSWSQISKLGRSLVEGLMCIDPSKRLSAAAALNHQWFWFVDCNPQPSTGKSDLDLIRCNTSESIESVFALLLCVAVTASLTAKKLFMTTRMGTWFENASGLNLIAPNGFHLN